MHRALAVPVSPYRPRPRRVLIGATCTLALAAAALAGSAVAPGVPTAAAISSLSTPVSTRFDLEGHRGARGLRPEQTLAAFGKALDIGVRTLDARHRSHEGRRRRDPSRRVHQPARVQRHPSRLRRRPCLSLRRQVHPHLDFCAGRDARLRHSAPHEPGHGSVLDNSQLPVPGSRIPTLDQVFALVEARHADDVQLNIETKIDPTAPANTVGPEEFVARDLAVIRAHPNGIARSLLQSFDWRTLAIARTRVARPAPGRAGRRVDPPRSASPAPRRGSAASTSTPCRTSVTSRTPLPRSVLRSSRLINRSSRAPSSRPRIGTVQLRRPLRR